ncbi:MAG: FAD:protein FMN transferase [Haliscomenobacter sp.]|uniref:FAD:protein FMN transferase n=1 Tax=Haliscomenobacter sp. TaxID=2717303 RepID=UPI0029B6757B|nr:FAD:protein FMN transferase [Haliscomenobacter sp.]MDX2067602.1 FAD:protein FMN transferase [Haliscomenobacter sp.]
MFQVVLYTNDTLKGKQIAKKIFNRIDSLNALFSDYLESSEINRLSASAGTGGKVKVSPEMWRLITLSQKIAKRSNGAFDLSVGPLSKLWRRAFRQSQFPTKAEIEEAKAKVNCRSIQCFPFGKKIRLLEVGIRLDAGGIAKGFTVDECFKILRKAGISSALVAAGGDIRVGAPPPGKTAWIIASKGLSEKGETVDIELSLVHAAVSTSGDTYRFLDWEGQRYSHIIDPRTGLGIQHRQLSRVIGPKATLTDALATAFNVSNPEERKNLMKKFSRYSLEVYKSKD